MQGRWRGGLRAVLSAHHSSGRRGCGYSGPICTSSRSGRGRPGRKVEYIVGTLPVVWTVNWELREERNGRAGHRSRLFVARIIWQRMGLLRSARGEPSEGGTPPLPSTLPSLPSRSHLPVSSSSCHVQIRMPGALPRPERPPPHHRSCRSSRTPKSVRRGEANHASTPPLIPTIHLPNTTPAGRLQDWSPAQFQPSRPPQTDRISVFVPHTPPPLLLPPHTTSKTPSPAPK